MSKGAADPKLVPDIYKRLLDVEKVDLLVGGYGDNSVSPAGPLVVDRYRYLVALMALAVNATANYPNYFAMIPTGPQPSVALTDGFFQLAANQSPKPRTMAVLAADAPFSRSPVQGAKGHAAHHGFEMYRRNSIRFPLPTSLPTCSACCRQIRIFCSSVRI
jgi:branched-chain amino acid transport system substrate-binding protein